MTAHSQWPLTLKAAFRASLEGYRDWIALPNP